MNTRQIVLRLLSDYENNHTFVNLSLNSHLCDGLDGAERAFAAELLYTVVERKITLDHLACAFAARSLSDMDAHTLALLRIGICQILYLDGVPDYAAVSETVALARHSGERGLVNAVLRRCVREKDRLPLPDPKKNYARALSVSLSFPLALVKDFLTRFGEDAPAIFRAFNERRPTTLFHIPRRRTREEYIKELASRGIEAVPTPRSPYGVEVISPAPVVSLPGFDEGEFFVQDEASQLAVLALAPRPGDTVLDVCACPGGKTFAAAAMMGDAGTVRSFDLHESKIPLIRDGAARLALHSVRAAAHDATEPMAELVRSADRVICDVPCSGLGVLGKKPDLRYRDLSTLDELPPLQRRILEVSASYVREGGVLLYSTCTLRHEENEDVVRDFLASHPEFLLSPICLPDRRVEDGMLTLFPHTDFTDGFFFARLYRTKDNE